MSLICFLGTAVICVAVLYWACSVMTRDVESDEEWRE